MINMKTILNLIIMKKILLFSTIAILVLTGCTKNDISKQTSLSQTISSDAVIPELSTCKMRRIYQTWTSQNVTVTALFTYNSAGNPVSILYSNGGTGVDDHYFIYDAQRRLKQWKQTWGDFPIRHHFFTHDANNRIVRDSTSFLSPADGTLGSIDITTFEYDAQNRVIKETIVNTYNVDGKRPTRRPTYTYDARGNLAVAGWKSSSYDYKINPLRQNAVFQFVMRNYSNNNAAAQPRYNSRKEPLSIKPSNDFLFNNLETTKIVYDCQ